MAQSHEINSAEAHNCFPKIWFFFDVLRKVERDIKSTSRGWGWLDCVIKRICWHALRFMGACSATFPVVIKLPDKSCLGKERIIGSQTNVLLHHCGEATEAEAGESWSHGVHSQEHSGECLCSAHFLLSTQMRIPSQGMVPHTVGRSSHISYKGWFSR